MARARTVEFICNISQQQQAERFEKYVGIARKIAWNMSQKFDLPFADLCDEAESILGLALADHWVCDTARAGESTWVYKKVYWPLLTFCTRRRERAVPFSTMGDPEEPVFEPAARPHRIQSLLRDLGDDAKTLVMTVTQAPLEIVEDLTGRSRTRALQALCNFFCGQNKWPPDRFARAWNEVKACLA